MKRIRYQVATSLDGYIAGPNDDFDWIVPEPEFDFAALHAQFDTLLMGRRTWEIVKEMVVGAGKDTRVVVASRTLDPAENPGIDIIADDLEGRVRAMREQDGKDIWLYGGGQLFATLLRMGLVDTVEPAIIPILLGRGVPFLPEVDVRRRLKLDAHRTYPSGMMLLEYSVASTE